MGMGAHGPPLDLKVRHWMEIQWKPVGDPWVTHARTMGHPWATFGQFMGQHCAPWETHEWFMADLSAIHGLPMEYPWDTRGAPMKGTWGTHVVPMGDPWGTY